MRRHARALPVDLEPAQMAEQARARNADDAARVLIARGPGGPLALPMLHELRAASCESRVGSVADGDVDAAAILEEAEEAPSEAIPLSVTALTGCVRQAFLKSTEPYYQRPISSTGRIGTLGHLLAERGPGVVAERRFERELRLPSGGRVTITGKPDEIDPSRGLLIDYKTTDRAPRQPSPLHVAQLNVYRWLVSPEYAIERLGIVYLTMKGVQKAAVPLWPEAGRAVPPGALGRPGRGVPRRRLAALTEDRWMRLLSRDGRLRARAGQPGGIVKREGAERRTPDEYRPDRGRRPLQEGDQPGRQRPADRRHPRRAGVPGAAAEGGYYRWTGTAAPVPMRRIAGRSASTRSRSGWCGSGRRRWRRTPRAAVAETRRPGQPSASSGRPGRSRAVG